VAYKLSLAWRDLFFGWNRFFCGGARSFAMEVLKLKVAVVGSRSLEIDVSPYIPEGATAIISGGAVGIDRRAAEYARKHGLPLIEFLPDYKRYGRGAPLRRNDQIINEADIVVVIWDGASRGTRYQIEQAKKKGKPCKVYIIDGAGVGAGAEASLQVN
jgi:uncharacterized phage-like protein YoqJ